MSEMSASGRGNGCGAVPFNSSTRRASCATAIKRDSKYLACALVRLASLLVCTITRSQKSLPPCASARKWSYSRFLTLSPSPNIRERVVAPVWIVAKENI